MMNTFRVSILRMLGVSFIIMALAGSNAAAQVVDTDSIPVSVIIGGSGTPPSETPTPGVTPTPGGGNPGGGGSNGGNQVKQLPSTGAAADHGSDLSPTLLALTGGVLLAGSVLVGRRRTR